MNQRPGKRRTIHIYSLNVSRNSIDLINQQQKRRKEKTLRILKKNITEKSFTSSKAIERVSFFLQTFIQLLQNHADEYLSCCQLIQNQFQTILYDVSISINFIFRSTLAQLFRRVWFDILETEAAGFDIWTLWFVPYNFKLRWRITNLIKREDEILL